MSGNNYAHVVVKPDVLLACSSSKASSRIRFRQPTSLDNLRKGLVSWPWICHFWGLDETMIFVEGWFPKKGERRRVRIWLNLANPSFSFNWASWGIWLHHTLVLWYETTYSEWICQSFRQMFEENSALYHTPFCSKHISPSLTFLVARMCFDPDPRFALCTY